MRVSSILLSLAAITSFAFAQDNAEGGDHAPAASAEGGDAAHSSGGAHKTKSAIGAHSSNTGQGSGTGNQDWVLSTFSVPNRNFYCEYPLPGLGDSQGSAHLRIVCVRTAALSASVRKELSWRRAVLAVLILANPPEHVTDAFTGVNEVNNTASWTPVNVTTNLAIYNSNSSILDGNKQIAAGIPAGTGSWTGLVSGFTPGNNYIMILTLGDQPDRKIAQTDGFWIKSKGTIPEASVTGVGNSLTGTLVAGSATNVGSATPAADAPAAASSAPGQNQENKDAQTTAADNKSSAGKASAGILAVAAAGVAALAF